GRAGARGWGLRVGAAGGQRVEDRLPAVVDFLDIAVGEDLADRLLHSGLGEIATENPVAIGAHHAGFESHGERELGDDHGQQGQDEDHREEREAPLVTPRAAAWHAHGAVTLMPTVTGGCSTGPPAIMAVTVTSTARGRARS